MNNYLLNGDLSRRRLQYNREVKDVYASMTYDGLQEALNVLLEEISQIKQQLDKSDEDYLKRGFPRNYEWHERAERALKIKNKQIGFIQKKLKERRKQAHQLQLAACENNKEIKKQQREIDALRSTLEERAFVKVCAERLDRKLYLDIWEEVKSRMNEFKTGDNGE